ncbi:MAG TPA: sigma 54-interacting transcriptional regulator [Bryobacteraceae bacterium]|nr:sigma 54-interacting transcriptional regulator [Bryobacteraceae bacterium]
MAISDLIGGSPKFRAVLDQISMVAPVDCAVLLRGETGTGKEVIAKAIHETSRRRQNRFVALNCAAIPSSLLESELFGHERGAFTGAVTQTTGRFQAADHGTLFLDEIGDLPLELQPKLLRVLQEQQIERLGGGRAMQVDVRIIAATNQDLGKMVQERKFRADLYYRLNVFPMMLPPLRERKDDIPLLVEYFVQKFAARHGKSITHIADDALEVLKHHDWPGNIRELQNFVERAVIMAAGPVLRPPTAELLRQDITPDSPRTLADAERAHIIATLRETNWVVGGRNGAAAKLGLPRTTLIARMRKLEISGETFGRREEQPDRQFATVSKIHSHSPGEMEQDDYAYYGTSSRFGNDSTTRQHAGAR